MEYEELDYMLRLVGLREIQKSGDLDLKDYKVSHLFGDMKNLQELQYLWKHMKYSSRVLLIFSTS